VIGFGAAAQFARANHSNSNTYNGCLYHGLSETNYPSIAAFAQTSREPFVYCAYWLYVSGYFWNPELNQYDGPIRDDASGVSYAAVHAYYQWYTSWVEGYHQIRTSSTSWSPTIGTTAPH
jgi:hypothetical protein